jgi:hypothetical protein
MQQPSERAPRNGQTAGSPALRAVPFALGTLLAITYLIAIPVGLISAKQRFGTPEIILAAVLLVILAFAAQTEYAVTDLTFGSGGVSAHFRKIEAGLNELEAEVRALQVSLTGLVTKFELINLQKLAADGPAIVRFGDIMQRELTHLDAMEFIRPTDPRGLNALPADHGGGLDDFDLKAYLEITQQGREYLLLRAQLAKRTATRQAGH